MNLKADGQFWRNSLSVLVFVNKPRVDVKLLLHLHGIFQICFTILHQAFMFGVFTFVQQSQSGLVTDHISKLFNLDHDDRMGFSSLKQTCNDDIVAQLAFVNVLGLHK